MFSFPSSSKSDHKFESSSTNPKRKRFDVYLSFCAKDAGSFAMSIYKTLSIKAGFVVFWEDKRLDYGDRIITPLEPVLNVIGKCKIVVIIFSRNYANTRRCLQELKKITECCQTTAGLTVLPLFHDLVYPSYGISKTCMFGDAFHNFVERILMEETSHEGDKFLSWVATISKATTYSGPIDLVQKPADRNKSEYIDNLVERVTHVINNKRGWLNCLNTMSINSRVQDVIQLLKQSKSPLLIGIWGMAGIGKTTIAQAIYHQIGPYFADKCFLKNVKGAWEQESGQVFLQQKLIFDIDQGTEIKIRTIESGKQILKYRFRHKRVLLVLDNVDKLEQLNALCENPEWFGVGSKIIITSRNRHLLKEHGFDHIYRVKELDESESLELFNYGAFRQTTHPQEDFLDLSKQVVAYSGGWPPALKEVGNFLHGKELHKWKDVLRRYQTFDLPSPEILEDLEMSFSDLSDEEKHIFLDIAYFCIGMNQNEVLQTLNRSTQCAALQINLLEDKSFLTIDKKNNLEMQVVLQAMAKDIIKRETSQMHRQGFMFSKTISRFNKEIRYQSHCFEQLDSLEFVSLFCLQIMLILDGVC